MCVVLFLIFLRECKVAEGKGLLALPFKLTKPEDSRHLSSQNSKAAFGVFVRDWEGVVCCSLRVWQHWLIQQVKCIAYRLQRALGVLQQSSISHCKWMFFGSTFCNLKNISHYLCLLFPECVLDVEWVLDADFLKNTSAYLEVYLLN